MSDERAVIAADWWRKKLERPTFDNGDSSFPSALLGGLAEANADKNKIPADRMVPLREALKYIPTFSHAPGERCDYGPDGVGWRWKSDGYENCVEEAEDLLGHGYSATEVWEKLSYQYTSVAEEFGG